MLRARVERSVPDELRRGRTTPTRRSGWTWGSCAPPRNRCALQLFKQIQQRAAQRFGAVRLLWRASASIQVEVHFKEQNADKRSRDGPQRVSAKMEVLSESRVTYHRNSVCSHGRLMIPVQWVDHEKYRSLQVSPARKTV